MTAQPSTTAPPLRVRVFLASPGDVTDERALALKALESLAYDPFLRGQIVVETVAWDKPGGDTPMLATMTPQEAISQQRPKPSECDIVLVIFWSRMGTPLPPEYTKPDGERYRSGTEWEYLDAYTAAQQEGRPRVLLYHRTEAPSIMLDDPKFQEKQAQWQLVKVFFDEFLNPDGSMRAGVNEYDTPDTFEKKLSGHLREIIRPLLIEYEAKAQALPVAPEPVIAPAHEAVAEPAPGPGSPFPGLRAFTEADAPIYFGRGRETDGLICRLAEGSRFITVVGVSGSGKSSLVAAGLLPRLTDNAIPGSQDWCRVRVTPGELGENPFIALGSGFRTTLDKHNRALRDEAKKLAANPSVLDQWVELMLEDRPAWSELVLFVDQFEELFTVVDPGYREAFSKLLAHAAKLPRLRTVATLRADFYQRCVEQPALAELLRSGSYPLAAPGVGARYEMITRPAERAGLSFNPEDLPERILNDAGADPGALPLMAFALAQIYEQRTDQGQLTDQAYDGFKGVQGAIGQRAEDTFKGLDAGAQAALGSVFRELVEVDPTDAGWVATRRRAPLSLAAATPEAQQLVAAFEKARLLLPGEGENQQRTVEVAHEALLRNWKLLVDWIQQVGEDLATLRQLRHAAQEWDEQQRRNDLRWPRRRWKQAEIVLLRLNKEADEPAEAFLTASRGRTRQQFAALGLVSGFVILVGWFTLFTYSVMDGNVKMALERVRYTLRASDVKAHEPAMVTIPPAGASPSFQMGSNNFSSNEKPVHPVRMAKPFAIGKHEVTFEQYDFYAQQTGARKPHDNGWGRGKLPVIDVTWDEAGAYARWLSRVTGKDYRLPTEAEWEYATRAGTSSPFWTGDCLHTDQANYNGDKYDYNDCGAKTGVARNRPVPVGTLPANPWGLYEVHGNVWELVEDCWHDDYTEAPKDGTAWEEQHGGICRHRVIRGGSWNDLPGYLRSAYRGRSTMSGLANYLGFRLAQDL